jgi:hypothetical protein
MFPSIACASRWAKSRPDGRGGECANRSRMPEDGQAAGPRELSVCLRADRQEAAMMRMTMLAASIGMLCPAASRAAAIWVFRPGS